MSRGSKRSMSLQLNPLTVPVVGDPSSKSLSAPSSGRRRHSMFPGDVRNSAADRENRRKAPEHKYSEALLIIRGNSVIDANRTPPAARFFERFLHEPLWLLLRVLYCRFKHCPVSCQDTPAFPSPDRLLSSVIVELKEP
ncbi:hypothetical protein BaRGS_00039599 [Batillaria attramentaria]|uniref:Uncharacterized protein n=1 Tax=Batillaria attramentaria TaxID=370345 RepID=A0ABD0J2Q4_9CAEN